MSHPLAFLPLDPLVGCMHLLWAPVLVCFLRLLWSRAGEPHRVGQSPLERGGSGSVRLCLCSGTGVGSQPMLVSITRCLPDLHSQHVRLENALERTKFLQSLGPSSVCKASASRTQCLVALMSRSTPCLSLLSCKLGVKMRDCSFSLGCCEACLLAEGEVICPESFTN